ncbi:energy transducer TonB family protein [Candidatus Chrysopegis kryptomonas]|jgi:hypothetical protein|uniref:Protein TonB n=1 Tax=Candidatus Chryseopegocella kryptomonas TaxID=1633643 RepID=A0A0P1MSF3_9BACT|nr:energy transducer TonB [Candidatus Chrysopegis kryptomonas]CUS98632.1 protein TonB [Candidatus Chrysopegis kryptomonas]
MEERIQLKSAIYTAIICFIVFLLMLIYKVTIDVGESVKFTEVIFVPPIEEQIQKVSTGGGSFGAGKTSPTAVRTVNLPKINLPTRFTITEEEILPQKFAEKIDVIEKKGDILGANYGAGKTGFDASLGKEIKPEVGVSGSGKSGIGELKKDFSGVGASPTLSYRIEWEGKINRIKVSGEMPRFPQGVRESAIVKFRVIVLPDGKIERIFPVEKANPEFERSVFEALQSWRFNAISENVKQSGVIIFNFRVE